MFYRRYFLCFIIFHLVLTGFCRVLPRDKSTINYTKIYFEEEVQKDVEVYELICFDSTNNSPVSPSKKIVNRLPAFWVPDLNWGSCYRWQVRGYKKNNELVFQSELHTFFVQSLRSSSFDEVKINVITNSENKNAGGLIFMDYTRSAYNRKGNAVWTMPNIEPKWNANAQIRDFKITTDNTLTFLAANIPVEMDYDGTILWSAPNPFFFNSDTIIYHHEFKKTKRGTYLVLGIRPVYRKITGNVKDEDLVKENTNIKRSPAGVYKRAQMSVLLEFDKGGNLIWFWDSNDYITDADMNYKKGNSGLPVFGTHANAFSENEKGTKVYLGFRDLSRIVKVDKKSKKVELSYGEKFPSGDGMYGCNAFRKQHDAGITKHNSILVLNNDDKFAKKSSVIELKDNTTKNDSALLWKFDLDFDTLSKGKSLSGGNVVELPNSNLLVCAGVLNRVFEVTRSKQVVWDAFVMAKGISDSIWTASPQYRCNWGKEIKHYYFIASQINAIDSGTHFKGISLLLSNTGNADDSYTLEVTAENGVLLYKTKIKTISQNSSQRLNLRFKNGSSENKKLSVIINSNNSLTKSSFTVNLN